MTATLTPREGIDRCPCGAKYWDGNVCHSCGATFEPDTQDPGYRREPRDLDWSDVEADAARMQAELDDELPRTAADVETFLHDLLIEHDDGIDVRTFENAGVMTYNSGLVVSIGDREYQLTIVQSR